MSNNSFFFSTPVAIILFIIGAGLNVYIFRRHGFNLEVIFNLSSTRIPTPRQLVLFGVCLAALFTMQFTLFKLSVVSWMINRPENVASLFILSCAVILAWPGALMQGQLRQQIRSLLFKCIWPYESVVNTFSFQCPKAEIPFIQVIIADGLTTLSKSFQDITITLCLSAMYVAGHQETPAYQNKLKHHVAPYFFASLPYIIRAQQCLLSRRVSTNANDKFLHTLNSLKYGSGILVILVGAFPRIVATQFLDTDGMLFLLCAAFNTLYSFFWDIVMDFGLAQPNTPKNARGLRTHRLYRHKGVYYAVIVADCVLRILWVTKWWERWEQVLGADFKFVAEVSEVFRRILWNIFRVEWQAIKVSHAGRRRKHISDFNKLQPSSSSISDDAPSSLSGSPRVELTSFEFENDNDSVPVITSRVAVPNSSSSSVSPEKRRNRVKSRSPVRRKSGGSVSVSNTSQNLNSSTTTMHHRQHAEAPV